LTCIARRLPTLDKPDAFGNGSRRQFFRSSSVVQLVVFSALEIIFLFLLKEIIWLRHLFTPQGDIENNPALLDEIKLELIDPVPRKKPPPILASTEMGRNITRRQQS
jgi:hypothetical protein